MRQPVAQSRVATLGDTDDLFYDASRQWLSVLGREGFVDVVQRRGDTLQRLAQVPTRDGTRTGLWVPDPVRRQGKSLVVLCRVRASHRPTLIDEPVEEHPPAVRVTSVAI